MKNGALERPLADVVLERRASFSQEQGQLVLVTAAPSNVGIVPAGVAGASSGNQGATPTDSNLFSGQSAIAGTASSQSPRGSLLSVDSAVAFGSSFMKNAEVASKTALLLAPIMAAVSAPVAAAIGAVAIGYAVYSVARMGYELYNHEDLWTGQPLSAVDEAGRLGGLVGGLAGGYGGYGAGVAARSTSAVAPVAAEVTVAAIRAAMADAPLATKQGAVSIPVIQDYVARVAAGEVAPAIKVVDGVIVDGNHRYIAGRLAGVEPAQTEGVLPPFKAAQPNVSWSDMFLDPTDWGNR